MDFSIIIKKFTDSIITIIASIYFILWILFITKFNSDITIAINKIYDISMNIFSKADLNIFSMFIIFIVIFVVIYILWSFIYGLALFIKWFFKFIFSKDKKTFIKETINDITVNYFLESKEMKLRNSNLIEWFDIKDTQNDSKEIIREMINTDLWRYWSLDFLETNYKTYFLLSIVSTIFALVSFYYWFYLSWLSFIIISFIQYIISTDYKISFNYAFYTISRVILFDIKNKNNKEKETPKK